MAVELVEPRVDARNAACGGQDQGVGGNERNFSIEARNSERSAKVPSTNAHIGVILQEI